MMAAKKILLVEGDATLRQSLCEQMVLYEEFSTIEAENGSQGLAQARSGKFDIILLDVDLPDMDGREVCRLMRQSGVKVPIIMLTAVDTDTDTDNVLGLDAGANDCVSKPFRIGVLLARLRAQLRQHEQNEDAVFTVGPYTFHPSAKMLQNEEDNIKIRLTEKETAILKFLYRAGNKPTGRDILLNEVWSYNSGVTTHTLETHIYRLRQKIEENPSEARILVTEQGGYLLR
jgi:DNA-binding response OmpR family regulator